MDFDTQAKLAQDLVLDPLAGFPAPAARRDAHDLRRFGPERGFLVSEIGPVQLTGPQMPGWSARDG